MPGNIAASIDRSATGADRTAREITVNSMFFVEMSRNVARISSKFGARNAVWSIHGLSLVSRKGWTQIQLRPSYMAIDQFVGPQVDALRASVEGEAWKPNHDAAMDCRDVEQILIIANSVYDLVDLLDAQWRLRLARGEELRNPAAEVLAAFDVLFDGWLIAADLIAARVVTCGSNGYSVDGSAEFLKRRDRATSAKADRK